MMIVHQAIYGEKLGSYALIKTSLTDTELAKRICNVTDLLDRPSSGHLTQPVFRGFTFNDYYLFIKSFPDIDPGVRPGRVLSHTLIVDKDDLHQLNDLGKLFSHFFSKLDKDPELNPIEVDDGNTVLAQIAHPTSREAAAINGLLDHSSYSNTLVWVGAEAYLPLITQIWSRLGGNLRSKLKLGVGFNPQNIDTQNINILYVLEEYVNKWQASDYCIVGKEDIGKLDSMSSFLLAGHEDASKPLVDLIETFGIIPADFEDYRYLEKGIATYNDLSNATFNSLIVLCDLISKYSPDQKRAKAEKNKLLKQVLSRIESASAEQILVLKNPEWEGFFNAQQLIGDQIATWVVKSLFNLKVDESITSVIAAAFDPSNEVQWWKKRFSDSLKTALGKWKPTYANVVWCWFTVDHKLLKPLGNLIPATIQVETDLVAHWPKPGLELAHEIKPFAKDRKWLILHGLSTLQLQSPEESVNSQLAIDTDPEHFAALQKMGELINDKEFIQLTVKIGESRLVKIAGAKVERDPSLLGQLDVKNTFWRQIWLKAIEHGNAPWDGIKRPMDTLFALFKGILNGEAVEPELLVKLSISDYNNLSSFTRRTEVWHHLRGSAKSGFLNASTLGCVKLLDEKNIRLDDFEEEIRICLTTTTIIKQVIEDQSIKVSTKIFLFEELPGIRENELLILLSTVHFSSGESTRLGKLIFRKRWKKATDAIIGKITTKSDLNPALIECKSLLSFFDKLRLTLSGHLSEAVSTEEWWSAFTEQCYTIYPNGPTQMGLWGRAGGEGYDLLTIGSGREIWVDAISKIRNGITNVDARQLLKEMLKDFHSNTKLEQLNKTYR